MKIALVTQGFQTAGGVQAVARWLRSGLVERGHEVHVYDISSSMSSALSRRAVSPRTWKRGPVLQPGSEAGLTMVGAGLAEAEPLRYLPTVGLTRQLASYDIVQVVCGGPALACVASRAGRPVAIQAATFMKWERESIHRAAPAHERLLRRLLTRWVSLLEVKALRSSVAVMVMNDHMLAGVRAVAPETRAILAPPGVDTGLFTPAPAWNVHGPIVAVGRLGEHRKGWDRIMRAYANLRREWRDAPRLVLAGRGDLTSEVWALMTDLGVADQVDVHRDLPHADLISLLRSGSVFWQTSHEEGLGIAALEAMSCGVPVIATETAGTRMTVLHERTGYLVPQDDDVVPSLFAAHTRTILGGAGLDMSRWAREHVVQRFDAEKTIDTFEEIYVSLALDDSGR